MDKIKCGNVFITEDGDFSFLCLNCSFVHWGFNEYRNHILDNHYTDYFIDAENCNEFGSKINCKIEKADVSEILTIEKLHEEFIENQSDLDFQYFYDDNDDDKSNFNESDEFPEIKVEITNDEEESLEESTLKCNENLKINSDDYDDDFSTHKDLYDEGEQVHKDNQTFNVKIEKKNTKVTKSLLKNFVCSYCEKVFYVERAFKKHLLIHETNSDKCETCGKRFRTQESLRNHIRRHKGERPFKCSVCSAAFNDKINLKTHYIVKHTEGLKVPCQYEGCGRIFKTGELRKRHEKYIHNSDRNYLCVQCGMSFKTTSKLNEHMKKKHLDYNDRPYECEFCKKKFIFMQDLKNHKMTHTGEKPFKCEMCTKAFIKKYELTKHIRKKHPYTIVVKKE